MTVVEVRRERRGDEDAVREVHRAAFTREGNDPPIETVLLDRLRADPGWLPWLSLVAVVDGEVVGHVVATRATLEPSATPVLGLAPLGVLPRLQRRGLGTALVHALLVAAEARDETLVGVLGEPGYYGRFGFVTATEVGVAPPDPAWGAYFQIRSLAGRIPTGRFRYAAPFDELG
jgi:predicted N-acetyltransferase YhbS